jgi:hypothetical protein
MADQLHVPFALFPYDRSLCFARNRPRNTNDKNEMDLLTFISYPFRVSLPHAHLLTLSLPNPTTHRTQQTTRPQKHAQLLFPRQPPSCPPSPPTAPFVCLAPFTEPQPPQHQHHPPLARPSYRHDGHGQHDVSPQQCFASHHHPDATTCLLHLSSSSCFFAR